MTPQNTVTIGKCACGHSRTAHERSKLQGCGFCACVEFRLNEVVQEMVSSPQSPLRSIVAARKADQKG